MGGGAEGLEGGERDDDDFAEFAKKLKEDYGEPEEWGKESARPEKEELEEGEPEEEDADRKELRAFMKEMGEKYGEVSEGRVRPDPEGATVQEDVKEQDQQQKSVTESQATTPPDERDAQKDAAAESSTKPAQEAEKEDVVIGTAPEKLSTEAEHFGARAATERSEDLREAVEPSVVGRPDEIPAVKGEMDDSNAVSEETTNSDPRLGLVNAGPTPEKLPDAQRFAGGAKSSEDVSNVDVMADNGRVKEDSKNEISGRRSSEELTEAIAKGLAVEARKGGVELYPSGDVAIITPITKAKEIQTALDSSGREGGRLEGLQSYPGATESSKAKPETLSTLESSKPESNAVKRVETQAGSPESERAESARATERDKHPEGPLAVFPLKAYRYQIPGREPDIKFDIRSDTFQRKVGIELEKGKVYEIHGRIGDICQFSKTHLEKEGNHVIIMVPKEHRDKVRSGRRYEIRIDSVEQRSKFRAERNGERVNLSFQPSALETFGFRPRDVKREGQTILEFRLNNLNRSGERPLTVFTQTMPHDGGARLSITRLGAKCGDRFEVLGIKEWTLQGFVKEFNTSFRPEELRNVFLHLANDRLSLDVDGYRFPFIYYRLSTRNLELVLHARLGISKREIRLWYDGQTFKARLEDCKIMKFKTSDHGLKLVYEASQHRISTISSKMYVDTVPSYQGERLTVREICSKLKLLEKPNGATGNYRFEVDSSLHEQIATKLQGLKGDAYNKARGKIGEDLVSAVLSLCDWEDIARHPLDPSEAEDSTSKHGPDSLHYFRQDGRYYLFETKWRKDVWKATGEAISEISSQSVRKKAPKEVSGGLVGIVDWKMGEKQGVLRVHEAWRKDQR